MTRWVAAAAVVTGVAFAQGGCRRPGRPRVAPAPTQSACMGGLGTASIGDKLPPQYRKRGAMYWNVTGSIRRSDEPHAYVMIKRTAATASWADGGSGMGESTALRLTGRPCAISVAEQQTAVRALHDALVAWVRQSGGTLVSTTPAAPTGFSLTYVDGPHRGTVTVAAARQRSGIVRIEVDCRERTPMGG